MWASIFLFCPALDLCFLWKCVQSVGFFVVVVVCLCFFNLSGDFASYSHLSLIVKCFKKKIQKSWLQGYQRASQTVAASQWKKFIWGFLLICSPCRPFGKRMDLGRGDGRQIYQWVAVLQKFLCLAVGCYSSLTEMVETWFALTFGTNTINCETNHQITAFFFRTAFLP